MNQYQLQMFNNLEQLVANSEAFYRQEFVLDGHVYWIYNYRLASYTEFMRDGGMECRGHMFEVDSEGKPIRLAALPMQKFFNLNENPFTMNLNLAEVDAVELKADGSLISSFLHDGRLRFKSKGSLFSEQAVDALIWIYNNDDFLFQVLSAERTGYTVNFEWCAPHNRIVIGYAEPHLKVLNVRHRETGQYMPRDQLELFFGHRVIERVNTSGLDVAAFVASIPQMQDDIEGYVCRIRDKWFKVKTEKYMSLHHAKDSVNNPRRLFEAIVDEGVDDLRSMFAHDALVIAQIDAMTTKVVAMYNHLVTTVEQYYETNKHLDRKDYAIGAQKLECNGLRLLGLAMNLYVGQTPSYKSFIKSKYKELGFKDTSTQVAE